MRDEKTMFFTISGALLNLVPFVQFKKREKHPWSSVNAPRKNLVY